MGRVRLVAGVLALLAVGAITAESAQAQSQHVRYFGYFAARITAAGGDHLPEVASRSNLNWIQISDPDRYAPEVLDGCRPAGCIISTGHEFFRGCDSTHDPDCELHPEYQARWGRLAEAVRSRIDKVGAFYLMDEPQWRGAMPAELQAAADTIKATYPNIPVMMVEAGPEVSSSLQIPTSVDWVGFDWYCRPFSDVEKTLATLTSRVHPHQSLFVVAESAPLQACGGKPGHATDAEIANLQYEYWRLAESNPRVIGLLAFGFWTSGYGSADLPLTVAAHEAIFASLAKPAPPATPVEIKGGRAKLSRRGILRIRVGCPAANPGPCEGKLEVRKRRGKRKALGSARFAIPAGEQSRVKVKLKRKARKPILRKARKRRGVKLEVRATTAGGTTTAKVRAHR